MASSLTKDDALAQLTARLSATKKELKDYQSHVESDIDLNVEAMEARIEELKNSIKVVKRII